VRFACAHRGAHRDRANGFDGQHVLFTLGDVHGFGVADAVGVK
jgi:hypothetical protein